MTKLFFKRAVLPSGDSLFVVSAVVLLSPKS